MSTKIYYAYEWTGDYIDLIKFLNELKQKYITDCIEFILSHFNFDSNKKHYENVHELLKSIKEDSARIEIGYPFDLSLSCMVYIHKGKTVVHFFGLNEYKYPATYESIQKMGDFSYWNNTDGPDDVNEEEFKSRGKWFDDLFDTYGSYIPSMCGLSYDFYSDDTSWDVANGAYNKWSEKNGIK